MRTQNIYCSSFDKLQGEVSKVNVLMKGIFQLSLYIRCEHRLLILEAKLQSKDA